MPAAKKAKPGKSYSLGKKGSASDAEFDLVVPSGALCRVKRPGPMGLIKMGLLDSLDSLTSLVQTEHFDRAEGRAKLSDADAIRDFAANSEKVQAGFELIDKITCGVVIEPEISPIPLDAEGHPLPREEWDPNLTYVDSVELHDKIYIMQFVVGGTPDLESFRAERAQFMGHVPNM